VIDGIAFRTGVGVNSRRCDGKMLDRDVCLKVPARRRIIRSEEVVKRSARRFRAAPVEISAVRVGA
jgi:hypothetical protein